MTARRCATVWSALSVAVSALPPARRTRILTAGFVASTTGASGSSTTGAAAGAADEPPSVWPAPWNAAGGAADAAWASWRAMACRSSPARGEPSPHGHGSGRASSTTKRTRRARPISSDDRSSLGTWFLSSAARNSRDSGASKGRKSGSLGRDGLAPRESPSVARPLRRASGAGAGAAAPAPETERTVGRAAAVDRGGPLAVVRGGAPAPVDARRASVAVHPAARRLDAPPVREPLAPHRYSRGGGRGAVRVARPRRRLRLLRGHHAAVALRRPDAEPLAVAPGAAVARGAHGLPRPEDVRDVRRAHAAARPRAAAGGSAARGDDGRGRERVRVGCT
mmetsp:Transcript_32845/g.98902  ORF Transcript_32845/g.98902 Transcript_32845/m.98902 type:complete len:337 (-) Transcript_32845:29-1039(-)